MIRKYKIILKALPICLSVRKQKRKKIALGGGGGSKGIQIQYSPSPGAVLDSQLLNLPNITKQKQV